MKTILSFILMMTTFVLNAQSIHTFKVTGIDGKQINLAAYKGKKILIVNTASKCGYTPQYESLQKVYDQYKDKLVIIGFPCNQFGGQEPGTNAEIVEFCEKNYGVTFPMMSKISVNGKKIHPVYKFLTKKSLNGLKDNKVEWNFQKYLLDEKGYLVRVISPSTAPDDASIVEWINK